MADDLQRIRSLLRGLVLRERLLLGARVALRTAALLGACLAFAFVAPALAADRASGVLALVVLGGAGAWAAVAWPLLREWSPAADPLRQAGRIEALLPDLRGRLLTAVDSALSGPIAEDRAALLGLVVSRAARGVAGVRPGQVHRIRSVLPSLAVAGCAGAAVVVSALAVGPTRAAAFWFRGSEALAAVADVLAPEAGEVSKVGDLTLRYTFPDYTGLEPKVVANGTGDVSAPPGTRVEVSARAATPAEAAGLLAYEQPLEAALDPDGRGIHGTFTVGVDEGAWNFVLYRSGASEPSREFAITPEQDLPPDVTLAVEDGLDVIEVPVDRMFPLEWAARDDFGVSRASLAVDGKEVEPALDRPSGRRADLQGKRSVSARDLGLAPGDRVRLSVVAWDNDTVSGSKRGESRAVELVVLGADGSGALSDARRDQLLDALIPVLAAALVEPWPPGETGAELARWGEEVQRRYQPLAELADELWKGRTGTSLERTVVVDAIRAGQSLVRYTQTAFEPGSRDEAPAENVRMTAELRTKAVETLEDAVAALAQLQRNAAYGEIARRTESLDEAARRLEEALARENPDAQEILAQLDQIESQLRKLAEISARLGDSPLREYVQGRESEIRNLMEEVRKALAEGRTDDARELAERLSQMMSDLAEGARQQMESASREADDSAEKAQEIEEELRQLEREQRELQREAQALRDDDEQERAGGLWQQIEEKSAEHVAAAQRWQHAVDAAGRAFHERQRAEVGVEEAEDLRASAAARDARGARMRLQSARNAWASARRAYEAELQRRPERPPGPGREALQGLQEQLDEIDALLDQLENQPPPDPAQQERSRDLEERQRQLEQRTREVSERARDVGQQMQMEPRGMGEALDQAGQRMQDAGDDLRAGRPMQAEGSQGQAAERLREAADAMQQARQQGQQMAREMQQRGGQEQGGGEPQEEGEGEGGGEPGKDGEQDQDLEIPGREEFRTPEEYRRALLEGMEGEVPEEYRAMKKRYFEELVSQ